MYPTGDILAFSGNGLISAGIRWRTGHWQWAWPPYQPSPWSHVGIVVDIRATDIEAALNTIEISDARAVYLLDHPPGTVLLESTMLARAPCLITGEKIKGVQCQLPGNRVDTYDGRVALLNPLTPLSEAQRAKLAALALDWVGRPYDGSGVALLGSFAWKHLRGFRAADRSSMFCSELVAEAFRQIGLGNPALKPGYASPENVVEWHGGETHSLPEWRT